MIMRKLNSYDFGYVPFIALNLNRIPKKIIEGVPQLSNLCYDKLLSESACVNNIMLNGFKIPTRFQNMLIELAVNSELSEKLVQMLYGFKRRTFKLLLPEHFRIWGYYGSLCRKECQIFPIFKVLSFATEVMKSALTMYNLRKDSKLRFVDLSNVPVESTDFYAILTSEPFKSSLLKPGGCGSCSKKHERRKGDPYGACCCCTSCDRLTFLLNISFHNDVVVDDFFRIIEAGREGMQPLEILLSGLHVNVIFYGEYYSETYPRLLDMTDPEYLRIFSFTSSIVNDTLNPQILSVMKRCQNLESLDLSHGYCSYSYVSSIADILGELHNLKVLLIQHNDLLECLEPLLCKMPPGVLEYLNVLFCKLRREDYLFLSRCNFAETLKHLDIGYNYIDLESLNAVITGCKNLEVLEMPQCEFHDRDITPEMILDVLSKGQNLKHLDIGRIRDITSDDILRNAQIISRMPNLEYLLVSYTARMTLYYWNLFGKQKCEREFQKELEIKLQTILNNPKRKIDCNCYF